MLHMKEYTQLTAKEREKLYKLLQGGISQNAIAKALGRNKSTISREQKRNKYSNEIRYLPDIAHKMAQGRRHNQVRKLDKYTEIKKVLIEKMEKKWSPDVIAAKSKELCGVKVSTETLYQFIYSDEGASLKLPQLLATRRPKRNKRHMRKQRKPIIPDRTSILERPDSANNRSESGHFEGDLTFFEGDQSANLLVLTERKSRFTLFVKNGSKKSRETIKNTFNALASIPEKIRKSVTFDNGSEFAKHALLRDHLGTKTYFYNPHSPWQKGQVEKTNAMLHRFIPKKTSIRSLSEKEINDIQNQFNSIPRKILGYKSPMELFNQELQGVALQT
jgi:IS30 family transposase